MKNILKSTLLLLCSVCLFASCDDDNDSNPTLISPKTFVLNTPAYTSSTIDLETSNDMQFSWQYPNYGFPMAVNYILQYSVNGKFDKEFDSDIDAADQTADFINGDSIYTNVKGAITAGEVAKKMQQLALYPEDNVPATAPLYIRAMAYVGGDTIYSNPITLTVAPYYVALTAAPPAIWYLTGACIGDGGWGNGADAVGVSMVPMYTVAGESYDKKDGTGKLTYTGYFPASSEFKIIETLGDWNYGICGNGNDLGTTYRDGGTDPGNIKIANAGLYTITLNTKTHECKIEASDVTHKVYPTMFITGGFDGWGTATAMNPMTTIAGGENHDWVYDLTLTEDSEIKFTDKGTWWGSSDFPYGTTTTSAGNIPALAGSYKVSFNDITGQFNFVAK